MPAQSAGISNDVVDGRTISAHQQFLVFISTRACLARVATNRFVHVTVDLLRAPARHLESRNNFPGICGGNAVSVKEERLEWQHVQGGDRTRETAKMPVMSCLDELSTNLT